MRYVLAVLMALVVLPSASPAQSSIELFARLSWDHKVKWMKAQGAKYRRDCAAVMSGQRGATSCLHIMELTEGSYGIKLRATMVGSMRQYCFVDLRRGRMNCASQSDGHVTRFILEDGNWLSIND